MKTYRRTLTPIVLFILMTTGFGLGQPGRPEKRPFKLDRLTELSGTGDQGRPMEARLGPVQFLRRLTPRINGLTVEQRTTLDELKQLSPDMRLALDDRSGTPFFMMGRWKETPRTTSSHFPLTATAAAQLASGSSVHLAIAERFLDRYKELLRLDDPVQELRLKGYRVDELGLKHLKFEQIYRGVPVWASELIVHLDAHDAVYALNGRFEPTPRQITSVEAEVTADRAIDMAVGDLSSRTPILSLPAPLAQPLRYHGPTAKKVIFPMRRTGEPRLAWMVNIRPNLIENWYYFIDARSGELLFKYNATPAQGRPATGRGTDLNGQQRELNVYQLNGTFFMIDVTRPIFDAQRSQLPDDPVGALWTIDARGHDLERGTQLFQVTSPDGTFADPSSVSAHFNVAVVFEYYFNTHGRRGIDDQGSSIISVIHVTDDNQPMDNAFWNGAAMAYGDGNVAFKPLAGGLDVAAHEMTHGVTQYTANLVYLSQPGALNESMSDVFAVMVDRDDLKIGEDVVKRDFFPTGAMRDLENPNQGLRRGDPGWQPAHMNEFVNLPETPEGDNGGVHVNSGIPNRAAALIIKAIGREKTERIYYRALTTYLTSRAQFSDARIAIAQAARDLFGDQSAEVDAVNQAFDAVGITDEATPPPPPPPTATGRDFIAYVRPDYTIGLITPDGSMNIATGSSQVRHDPSGADIAKLSVPRDGKTIWFTAIDGQVHFIDISNLNSMMEFFIQGGIRQQGDIMNFTVHPETTFSAATQSISGALAITIGSFDQPDPNMYFVDLPPTQVIQVPLRIPTTGQGVESNTIAFTDVIDWFADGSTIIYDAFNVVQQAGGGAITYWTFNLLRVDVGDSLPALPPQPEGISVGNPQFGSVTITLVAYNEVDDQTGVIRLKAIDYNQSQIFTLVDPTQHGFGAWRPTFSPDDRKMAFVDVRNLNTAPLLGQLLVADLTTGQVMALPVQAGNPEWFAKSR